MRATWTLVAVVVGILCVLAGCGCRPYVHRGGGVVAVRDCVDQYRHHVILELKHPTDGKATWDFGAGKAPFGRDYSAHLLFSSEVDFDAFVGSVAGWTLTVSDDKGSQTHRLHASRDGFLSGREAREKQEFVYPYVDRYNALLVRALMDTQITCGGNKGATAFKLSTGDYQPQGTIGVWLTGNPRQMLLW